MSDLDGHACLVTGASGFLGSFVVEKLIETGARVRCLVRRTSNRAFLPGYGVEYVFGDVTDPESVRAAVVGMEYVFHVAGLIRATTPEDYFRVNYLGTINLMEACRDEANRLARVVIVSSQAAAGPSEPGKPLDEASPHRPVTPYGRSKLLAEQVALVYRDRLPVTVVRPPTIYGPRDRETLLLFRVAALGLLPSLAGGGEASVVHASDLADGILLAATRLSGVGQTYFLAGDETLSLDDLLAEIANAVGRRGVRVPVPPWALRTSARLVETVHHVGGPRFAFDRWKAEEILSGYWACSNARAKRDLGFAPRVPLARGLADTAGWYRKMGWL